MSYQIGVLAIVALAAGGGLIGLFLAVRLRWRLPAQPAVRELDFTTLEPAAAEFLRVRTEDLIALGFEDPTPVHLPDGGIGPRVSLILLADRRAGDKAVVQVECGREAPWWAGEVGFGTWYETGEKVWTTNATAPSAVPAGAGEVHTHAPSLIDPAELCRLHRWVLDHYRPGGRKVVYPPGGGGDHMAAVLTDLYGRLARRWLFYLDEAGGCYRPTTWGALRLLWAGLPPGRWLLRAAVRRRERRVLAEFRAAHEG